MPKSVVVLLSGGMDSSTLLYHHHRQGDKVRALAFDYGQRHRAELAFASMQAHNLTVPFTVVDLHTLRDVLPGSSQTDKKIEVPRGHYTQENMKQTVVPNRNMILLSIAIGHAVAHKCDQVSYAAHGGDHAIYPDCRPEFAELIRQCAAICDWHPVELVSPFINQSKAWVAKVGSELGVDFSRTWSCYEGKDLHCGQCGTCVERREAFHLAGVPDPTKYSPDAPSVEKMVAAGWKI